MLASRSQGSVLRRDSEDASSQSQSEHHMVVCFKPVFPSELHCKIGAPKPPRVRFTDYKFKISCDPFGFNKSVSLYSGMCHAQHCGFSKLESVNGRIPEGRVWEDPRYKVFWSYPVGLGHATFWT